MTRKLFSLMKAAAVSAVFFSCSGGSDTDDANPIPNPGGYDTLVLVSSKTQGSVDTPFEFSLQNGITYQVSNINWDFGDGSVYYGNNSLNKIYHNYEAAGNYTVKATLLLANGSSIVKTVNITVTNTHLLKINKITIISIPKKTTNLRWINSGTSGYWQEFVGEWDESKSFGTNQMDKYADLFMEISKNSAAPDPSNPHQLLPSLTKYITTTGIAHNQMNLEFNLSAYNIVMGYEALDSIQINFKDSDAYNSLLENGGADELISSFSIPASAFTSTSGTFTQGGLSFKVDFQKL